MRRSWVRNRRGVLAGIVAVAGTTALGGVGAAGASSGATDVTIYAVEDGGTYCFSLNQTTCSGNVEVDLDGPSHTVTWAFPGPYPSGQAHNAASRGTNWSYTSGPPNNPPDVVDADYEFTKNGTYQFVCDAHPIQMTGTITVTGAADPTSTPTGTPTPTPTPTTHPGGGQPLTPPPSGGAADTVKPTVSSLRARSQKRSVKVTFRLSENSTVTIRVKRGRKVVKKVTKQVPAGRRTITVRSSKLRKGRYKIEVRARDASGNVSSLASKSLRLRK
jgi:plastocyanin